MDLVLATTHTNAHLEQVLIAARAGKSFMMGFTRRYERPWIKAVNIAKSGGIGAAKIVGGLV